MMIRTDPIFALLHQRSRATGTRLGEFDGLELYLLGSIAERIDAGHLRNHLARLLNKDIRTNGQMEAADIGLVVQRSTCHHRSGNGRRFKFGYGCDMTCHTHLEGHVAYYRRLCLLRELARLAPVGERCVQSQEFLVPTFIHFDNDAIAIVGQLTADTHLIEGVNGIGKLLEVAESLTSGRLVVVKTQLTKQFERFLLAA